MENIDQQPAPAAPNPPPSPDAVLAEQLARCHKAIGACFFTSYSTDYSLMSQLECLNVAERLMRVSIALAAALGKSGREFTHRIIVEHPAPMIDVTPGVRQDPPPPRRKSKTIHGGRTTEEHNIG